MNLYESYVPTIIMWAAEKISSFIHLNLRDYYLEVEGMAEAMEINTNILLIIQYIYELSSFCTSALVADRTGTVIHVRNLDFAFADSMRNITYEAWFYNGTEFLFKSVMFAGLNGVLTGERPGGFSISLNTRKPSHREDFWRLAGNIGATFFGRP